MQFSSVVVLVYIYNCAFNGIVLYAVWIYRGRNKGKPGSMVIASENDDLYMCDIEVFESTYESTGRPGEYRKIGTILATRMPEAFAIKTESGSIEQGNAGDYLVQVSIILLFFHLFTPPIL